MSRLLFVLIPERGHLHPYLGPAQHLRARGHEVHVYAEGPVGPWLASHGLPHWPGEGGEGGEGGEAGERHAGAAFSAQVRDPAWLHGWIERMLLDGIDAQVARIEAVMERLRPDGLVLDPMVYAGAIAAHRQGRPWAAVSNSLNPVLPDDLDSALLRTVAQLAPRRAAIFARHGLAPRFRGCDLLSDALTVCFSSPQVAGPAPAGVHLVGASLPVGPREPQSGVDWAASGERPRVLMSLGSQVYHQPRMFQVAAAALRELGAHLIASVGELHPDAIGPCPPGSVLRPFLPQLEVLPHVDAMITHGGANSVMEALAHEVPLLVSPICNDQFHQAELLRRRGLARVVDLHTARPAEVRAALEELLHPAARRRLAGCLPRDGALRCAELLERWIARAPR
ncbi:MAG: glycosyltransferase family 1 protein [Myxococcales bacterium]|nr:glycosyltransferase family 1 protein [Myxococcales bacterium]